MTDKPQNQKPQKDTFIADLFERLEHPERPKNEVEKQREASTSGRLEKYVHDAEVQRGNCPNCGHHFGLS